MSFEKDDEMSSRCLLLSIAGQRSLRFHSPSFPRRSLHTDNFPPYYAGCFRCVSLQCHNRREPWKTSTLSTAHPPVLRCNTRTLGAQDHGAFARFCHNVVPCVPETSASFCLRRESSKTIEQRCELISNVLQYFKLFFKTCTILESVCRSIL